MMGVVRSVSLTIILCLMTACGSTPQAANPTPSPVVVTQIVRETVVVTSVATEVVTVIVSPTPAPATATPAPTSAPPSPTPLPAIGKWQVVTDTSSFDDSLTVLLILDADDSITSRGQTTQPTLILRCAERTMDAYIVTDMTANPELGLYGEVTTRIRFDSEDAETLVMGESTDNTALFFDAAERIINRMAQHERMLFEFTPFNSSPVQTTFDLRGLPQALPQLQTACE